MKNHFESNKEVFSEIAMMWVQDFEEKGILSVKKRFIRTVDHWSLSGVEAKERLGARRWFEYKKLFGKIDIPSGIKSVGKDKRGLLFMIRGVGMAGSGNEYGIMWSEDPPEQVDTEGQLFKYEVIEEDWYIYWWNVY